MAMARKAIEFGPKNREKLGDEDMLFDSQTLLELLEENVEIWEEIIQEEAENAKDEDGMLAVPNQ